MSEKWITIGEFVDATQAHLVQSRLRAADIDAVIENENFGTWMPQFGVIHLRVRESDLPDIEAVLADVPLQVTAEGASAEESSEEDASPGGPPVPEDAVAEPPWVVVGDFPDEWHAHIALLRLKADGIDARMMTGFTSGRLTRRPSVAVVASESDRAREILANEAPTPLPPRCPACGSGEVRVTRFTHPLQWIGLLALLGLLAASRIFAGVPSGAIIVWIVIVGVIVVALLPRAYACRQCAHRWRADRKDET